MKRENGFFIINKMSFTNEEGDKNSFRDNALDLDRLYKKYDQNDIDNTTKYEVAYWLDSNHIVIDCDTQEQTTKVLEYISKLGIETYWYYSTKEKGSAHFWFEIDSNVRMLIDAYKLNSNTKVGLYEVDTRAFREASNKKYQGAVYLRKREKENSLQRPTPLQLMQGIEKVLPICPLGLIVPSEFWTIPVPSFERTNEGDPGRYSGVFNMFKVMLRRGYDYDFASVLGKEMFKFLGYDLNDMQDFDNGIYKARWTYAVNTSIKEDQKIPKKADLTDDSTLDVLLKNIRFFNKDYYMFAKELGIWVNLSTISNGIGAVYRHLQERFELTEKQLKQVLNTVELNSLVNQDCPYNTTPYFKNGYFNEDMNSFISFEEEIPLHLFKNDVKYLELKENQLEPTIMKWLINMFGSREVVDDFFTNISPIIAGATASTWIVLFQPSKGNAGKSSLQQMLRDIVGKKNTAKLDTSAFFNHEAFSTRNFKDKTYIYSEEDFTYINHNAQEMIKSNINNGQADLNVNVKYSNISSIKNTLSWLSSTNSMPIFSIIDEAFTSRLLFYEIYLTMLPEEDQWIFEPKNRMFVLPTLTHLLVEGFKRWTKLNGFTKRNAISKFNSNEKIFKNCWENDIYADYFTNTEKKNWSYNGFNYTKEKVDKKQFNAYKNNFKKIEAFNAKYGITKKGDW